MKGCIMAEGKEVVKIAARVTLEKNKIVVYSTCHKDKVAESANDFEKDGGAFVDAGEKECKWCKKVSFWPEAQAKIFTAE